jgi:glycylpeptide N-tetradecanoyltransferase
MQSSSIQYQVPFQEQHLQSNPHQGLNSVYNIPTQHTPQTQYYPPPQIQQSTYVQPTSSYVQHTSSYVQPTSSYVQNPVDLYQQQPQYEIQPQQPQQPQYEIDQDQHTHFQKQPIFVAPQPLQPQLDENHPTTSSLLKVPNQVIRKLERSDNESKPQQAIKKINKSVFKASFWDQAPFKRNNQERNHIINVDYTMDNNIDDNDGLPSGYEWISFDPENNDDITTMTTFLNKHYQKFDKEYKPMYLRWLLTPPIYNQYKRLVNVDKSMWCIGVQSTTGVLVGLITARPTIYRIDAKYIQTFTIDFLCTHKRLRGKRLSPVLIKEMYKRLSMYQYDLGSWFVTNTHLPFSSTVKTSQILFRPLTLEKLSKTLFAGLSQQQLTQLQYKYENIQPTEDLQLIRFANLEDVPIMMNIYEEYCQKYRLCQTMNREEFEHYFLPNNELIFTYVITNVQGEIKDFVSLHAFWTKRGEKNAYVFYVSFINELLLEHFMRNVLFIMKSNGFDMIFANDVMGISDVLSKKLDFKSLDEICNYYVFNYNTQTIEKNECGMNRIF